MPSSRCFDPRIPACPALPMVEELLTADSTRCLGAERGMVFHRAALCYAQSLWREGKPAQAILQLNKAWSADLDAGPQGDGLCGYRALVWMLRHAPADRYLGNPVRHFQHLATRMSGPRPEVRAWRAWACFHLAERVLAGSGCHRDHRQIAEEKVAIPDWPEVVDALGRLGWRGEAHGLQSLGRELGIA